MIRALRDPGWFTVHNVDFTVSNLKQLTSAKMTRKDIRLVSVSRRTRQNEN